MFSLSKNTVLQKVLQKHLPALAKSEALDTDLIEKAVTKGSMVLLANPAHENVIPTLIGQPARVKVNANIGTSPFMNDRDREMKKLKLAWAAGAHTIMDLSTAGDLNAIRKGMLAECPLPLGTVPIYSTAQKYIAQKKDPALFSEEELFEEIVRQAGQGVDFMTVH